MKKYSIKILFVLAMAWLFQACCDCPLEPTESQLSCHVREATVTLFNPRVTLDTNATKDSVTTTPVAEYSIHSFQFPSDNSSSGLLPNDERYSSSNDKIVIAKEAFSNGQPYYVALMDFIPFNSDIKGDFLVDSVFIGSTSAENRAFVRFYGWLSKIDKHYSTENADEFCDSIKAIPTDDLRTYVKDTSRYGLSLNIAQKRKIDSTVYILDRDLNVIGKLGSAMVDSVIIAPSIDDITKLWQTSIQYRGIDIEVKIGDIFYYISRSNQRAFVVYVVDIKQGTLEPKKKRVTIMFNPVDDIH